MGRGGTLKGVAVGAGYFSHYQLDAWGRIPEVEIAAVCDRAREKAGALAGEFGVPKCYTDYREMVESEAPDFIDIITPPDTHREMCEYAAERGVNVICQKPLAPTYEEAVRLVEGVRASGVRFMVHENWRWQPWYREVKALQEEGVLGETFSVHFRMRMGDGWAEDAYMDRQPFFREYPRLLIHETGVHFLDTFRFLLGEVASVYARLVRRNPAIKGEDSGVVVLGFRSGATATLDASRYNETDAADPRYTFGEMRVDGSLAHLLLDTEGEIDIKPLGRETRRHEYAHENRGFCGDSCFRLQRHFVDCFLNGRNFESTGEDYLKTLRVVEACYRSAETGEVVRVEPDNAD